MLLFLIITLVSFLVISLSTGIPSPNCFSLCDTSQTFSLKVYIHCKDMLNILPDSRLSRIIPLFHSTQMLKPFYIAKNGLRKFTLTSSIPQYEI